MFRLRIMRAEYLTRAGARNYQFMVVSTSTKKKENKDELKIYLTTTPATITITSGIVFKDFTQSSIW